MEVLGGPSPLLVRVFWCLPTARLDGRELIPSGLELGLGCVGPMLSCRRIEIKANLVGFGTLGAS